MGEGREDRGGKRLLQASREQDIWLDTSQSYTAKGCKRAMGKPCVCHLVTYTYAHRHTLIHSCAHLLYVMRGKGLKQKEKEKEERKGQFGIVHILQALMYSDLFHNSMLTYTRYYILNFSLFSLPTIQESHKLNFSLSG